MYSTSSVGNEANDMSDDRTCGGRGAVMCVMSSDGAKMSVWWRQMNLGRRPLELSCAMLVLDTTGNNVHCLLGDTGEDD